MKRFLSSLTMLGPVLAFAQDLGTKKEVTTTAASTAPAFGGGLEILQLLVAVAIVGALLKWVLPKLLKKSKAFGNGKSIEIEETSPLGQGQIHVVTVHGRRLVLGSTQNSISLLAELSDWPTTAYEADQPAATKTDISAPAFFELLDREIEAEDPFEKKLMASRKGSVPQYAVIEREVEIEDDELSLTDAQALLETAKAKAGLAPEPSKAPETDDEIMAALDRISRLSA